MKLPQTITFPALATRFFNDVGTPLLATSTSKLAIAYQTTTPKLCQLLNLGGGRVTVQPFYPLSGGDNVVCRIFATQPGNAAYEAAIAVEQTITFQKQSTRVVYRTSTPTVTEAGTYLYATAVTTNDRRIVTGKQIGRAHV